MKKYQKYIKPFSLFALFGALITVIFAIGGFEYFKWSVWKEIHGDIKQFVYLNLPLSIILAIALYVMAILTFLPGLLLFDLLVGYMFPQWIAMLVIMTSAVVGAMVIMAGCRFGFKNFSAGSDNKLVEKVKSGFAENETLYLLFLRVMPFFPFAFVTAALSSLSVSYKKVALTTFIGMCPIALVLTSVGNSLGTLMTLDAEPSFTQVVSPSVMIGLFLLSAASVSPILLKALRKRLS